MSVYIGLSLYQKICDLKVTEIAVQIVNRDKAILKSQEDNTGQTTKEPTEKQETKGLNKEMG